MPRYNFTETLRFFGEKIDSFPSQEDLDKGATELMVDEILVSVRKALIEDGLIFEIGMGLIVQPLWKEHLREMAISNYLGINTSGCTLVCNAQGSVISLKAVTTPGSTPQESWEWLHRILCVARQWGETLTLWDEIIPFHKTEN